MDLEGFEVLDWDSSFFGFKVARITAENIKEQKLHSIISHLKMLSVRLIYWETDPENIEIQALAQKMKGTLVDRRVEYRQMIGEASCLKRSRRVVELKVSEPSDELIELAIQSGEFSRFKVDKHIPDFKFRVLYENWVRRSVTKKIADSVYVARNRGRIVGFVTLKKDGECGRIGLVAVDKCMRGQGLGTEMIQGALFWFKGRECKIARVATQKTNRSACALYEKNGFWVERERNIYHFWI